MVAVVMVTASDSGVPYDGGSHCSYLASTSPPKPSR